MREALNLFRKFLIPTTLCLCCLLLLVSVHAQVDTLHWVTPGAPFFWKESFDAGTMPEGWENVDMSKKGASWLVTNQPYPGSFEYQQQAPPIASGSRGYHLQFQAGYIVDEDQPSWEKKGEYPDAYVRTSPVNCSGRNSVILRFQHSFRFNDHHPEPGAGLFVGVSDDGKTWTDFNVRHQLPPATEMFIPIREEVNISAVAANKPAVYLRFYWKGYYSWYWMIDDLELGEAHRKDLSIVRLVSHNEASNRFSSADQFVLRIKNTGTDTISSPVPVQYSMDSLPPVVVETDNKEPWPPFTERDIRFPAVDLTGLPSHRLDFQVSLPDDEMPGNNRLQMKINAEATRLGNLTAFHCDSNACELSAGVSKVKVIFYGDDIFRIWLAPDGIFTNPAADDITSGLSGNGILNNSLSHFAVLDKDSYLRFSSKSLVVRAYKNPIRFAMYDAADSRMIWEEMNPLLFGSKTVQSLSRGPREYFYGCGMQNGYFSHRGKEILIEKGNGWDDGGRANPAPFYMSTAGYGVLRNTFDAGKYSFADTLVLSHNENRFDAFYFYGPTLKRILDRYTDVSGKPFLMPRWALSLGDANCYNKPGRDKKPQTTPDVIWKVADKYLEQDMPRGWILPNDGYGCGYVKLDSTVTELRKRGFYTGLWTENGVSKIATEVSRYGTRLCKLDVAWVGPGYKYALDGCKAAYNGIENNSNARGFVWSVMGWAGTQRYSTVWSGDQSGNWEYIRFHIPTFIGSGLSAQNAASSDIDGIFGGSDSTYVRDLQWKCFIPVLMTMSGWAKKDKQPWTYGEPYTSINRKYLQLKMRLTPYMYSYCYEASKTGVPATRGMVLEFPRDSVAWGKQTQYQFMNGEWLLVAPVFKPGAVRDSIYLPEGQWTDYWDGTIYSGGRWLRNYIAPLEKLPVFVRAGAIIPMYPAMNFDRERKTDTVTLDLYPSGTSSFDLYEDDGLTREYRTGAFSITRITVKKEKRTHISIKGVRGSFTGINTKRSYLLTVHQPKPPKAVLLNQTLIPVATSRKSFNAAKGAAIFFDSKEKNGVLFIRTTFLSTHDDASIECIPY